MAKCKVFVRRGQWMVDGMFDKETGERFVLIEAQGKFTAEETEDFVGVVTRVAAEKGATDAN